MTPKLVLAGAAFLALAACGTTPTERAITGAAIGGVAGAAVGNNVGNGDAGTGAAIGAVGGAIAGAATTPSAQSPSNRRERHDERSGRYYFWDPGTQRYYYENGQPYP